MDSGRAGPSHDWLSFGPFEFSATRRELRRGGHRVDVGQRGLDLLAALLAGAGQPVSKARLIQAAWNGRAVEQSNLTVQIAMLRRQLGPAAHDPPDTPPLIRTVPGFGYVFAASVVPGGPIREERGHAPMTPPPANGAIPPVAPATAIDYGWWAEPLTLFIGREEERRSIARLLATGRLLTVTGMGGVGKTRLVMRLRNELASAYADGVSLVDLAPLVEAQQVDEAVAAAFGVGGGAAAAAALVNTLRDRHLLLILDNAEHLQEAVVRLIERVFAHCTRVSVMVTSRETLGLPGEIVFLLSPLGLPPEADALTAAEALGCDSVRLLVDRLRALLPWFELDDAGAPHAAAICRRLDGIALAIEMAVPRLAVLSLRQLADRLQDRFGALAGQRHDVHPRQRTLRAMFD